MGAKRSRPWKVVLPGGTSGEQQTARQSLVCRSGVATPLSGPTKKRPSDSIARGRRPVPTPGSTTTRCTVPTGHSDQ
jgi:hypothetical protein